MSAKAGFKAHLPLSNLRRLAISLVAVSALIAPAASGQETVVLAADEWCPYNCTPGSDRPGFMIEIAQEVLKPHGIGIDYRVMPWQRAVNEAVDLKIDGVIAAVDGEHEELVVHARPYGSSTTVVMVRADSPFEYKGTASLDGHQIGIIRGYSYGEALDAYIEASSNAGSRWRVLSGETALQQMLRLIAAKRLDMGLEDEFVARLELHELGFGNQIKLVSTEKTDPVFLSFGRSNPRIERLFPILDAGIDALRQSGRLAVILQRYGLSDWEAPVN